MHIGHRQTRNRGTIGGSLCHLDPAAELVSVCAAHDATVTVAGPNGTREFAFADFPAGYLTPAIELNEIVTAIRFPLWPAGHKAAFIEFSRRHGDFAIVSAAALLADRRRQDRPRLGHRRRRRGGAGARQRRREGTSLARRRRASCSPRPANAAARSTRWPTSTPRPITGSTSPPCYRAARWRMLRALPTKRRGIACGRGDWQHADKRTITVNVNGHQHRRGAAPLHARRFPAREFGLTGTHLGCEHGVCGACTVLSTAVRCGAA